MNPLVLITGKDDPFNMIINLFYCLLQRYSDSFKPEDLKASMPEPFCLSDD